MILLFVDKTKNKNGNKGDLNRTKTPNKPEVYPAKNPKIMEKMNEAIKNSFDRIIEILANKLPLKTKLKVSKIKKNDSSADN